jgi:hypothetical protein
VGVRMTVAPSFDDPQRGEVGRTPGAGTRATAAVADWMYSMHGVSEHRGTLTKHVWPPSGGTLP